MKISGVFVLNARYLAANAQRVKGQGSRTSREAIVEDWKACKAQVFEGLFQITPA